MSSGQLKYGPEFKSGALKSAVMVFALGETWGVPSEHRRVGNNAVHKSVHKVRIQNLGFIVV